MAQEQGAQGEPRSVSEHRSLHKGVRAPRRAPGRGKERMSSVQAIFFRQKIKKGLKQDRDTIKGHRNRLEGASVSHPNNNPINKKGTISPCKKINTWGVW